MASKLPKYVTKFFAPEDLHFFKKGSLRFGTLNWYSDKENEINQGARFDAEEGRIEAICQHDEAALHDVELPGISASGGGQIVLTGAKLIDQKNDYVFCSSLGYYTKKLHQSILAQSPSGYPGNRNLTGYVTFRANMLLEALHNLALAKFELPPCSKAQPWMCASPVCYGDRSVILNLQSGQKGFSPNPSFIKPPFFAPENEYRIILNKDYPYAVQKGASDFCLEGKAILNAMCFAPQIIKNR